MGASSGLALSGHCSSSFGSCLCVAKVIVANRLQVRIQFIDQRNAIGYVQFHNRFVRDVVQVLDQGANLVAMRRNHHTFARFDGRG